MGLSRALQRRAGRGLVWRSCCGTPADRRDLVAHLAGPQVPVPAAGPPPRTGPARAAAPHFPDRDGTLRLALVREHLDRELEETGPARTFEAFARSAAALRAWHDGGRAGPRPPSRLRPLLTRPLTRATRLWASPLYRTIYDPDARPLTWRWRGRYRGPLLGPALTGRC